MAKPEEAGGSVGVVVPAAGSGRRMGGRKKAFLELLGEPVLLHALRPFLLHRDVRSVVVALQSDDLRSPPGWLTGLDPRVSLVEGGATRFESVRAGLDRLDRGLEVVLVHDAARPLVSSGIIARCIDTARSGRGAVAGWPSTDTLKEVDARLDVRSTPDRSRIWRAQTPQAFPFQALMAAYRSAREEGEPGTDDAVIFERAGGRVRMVEGSAWNLKITHDEDLAVAELLLRDRARRRDAGAET